MEKFDYLVVGSGLYGAIFAHEAKAHGKSVLVVDKRPNIAGNIYTENVEGINVHKYGAHIFHTNNKNVWNYITQFAEFNRFTNSPVANYKGELYSLPFNMYTFNKMWGVVTPEEAASKIEEQRKEITHEPQNLEEQAISLVGRDIYGKLIKGYTEKQWGRDCKDLPPFIIKRLPVRLTFDNNYFNKYREELLCLRNKPKTVTADFATQIAEKQSEKEALSAEIASIIANIDTLKADLKEKKNALKRAEKEVAMLETKKAKADAKAAEETKKAEAESVLKKLLAEGMSADEILAKLK